jgi:hypothetical protein
MIQRVSLIILLLSGTSLCYGQFSFKTECAGLYDYGQIAPLKDSNEVHSPKKAAIMSAFIPGLGQVYNGKYWKTGLVYVAGAGLGYALKWNNDSLKGYQSSLVGLLDDDTTTTNYLYPDLAVDKIRGERNYYRKKRDQMILGLGLLYALQIIDASVDAHLREFEINEDLAWKPRPGFILANQRVLPSVGISFHF